MNEELREAIRKKYKTEADMAREIGWSKQRLFRLTHGLTEMKVEYVPLFAKALDVSVERIVYFFTE